MDTLVNFLLFSPVYIPLVISLAIYTNAERNNIAKKVLAIVLLNIAFLFFGLYFFLSGNYEFYAKILPVNVASLLLIYPSIYIYIRLLIKPDFSIKKILLHLLPAVITMLESLVYYFMLDAKGRVQFVEVFRFSPVWGNPVLVFLYFWRVINIIILFFQIFFYGIKTIIILRKYSATILNIFSNTEGITLNSIKIINMALLIGSVASVGFYSINPVKVFGNYIVLIIPLAIISIAIWALGIIGLRQKMISLPISLQTNDIVETPISQAELLFKRLDSIFVNDKPYLNAELKIDDLISALGTNRTHLSNAINQFSGKNFNRYVNDYRIEYAISFIKQNPQNCNKNAIADASGFGSIRSFERNFKENTGRSVNEWITTQ